MSDPIANTQTKMEIAGCTHTGVRRPHNQDHIDFDEDLGIAVLADGMGGHQAGEVASQMAVEFLMERLKDLLDQQTTGKITDTHLLDPLTNTIHLLDSVSNTISECNTEIVRAAEARPEHKGMGTTVVTTLLSGSHLYIGHAGDSRLYLYRERQFRRITKDHSLVENLIDRGFYSEREAKKAPISNVVTRALGISNEVEADAFRIALEDNDQILICSDGLTDMVDDWQISDSISDHKGDLAPLANYLVDLANKHGGKDNISVILMKYQ